VERWSPHGYLALSKSPLRIVLEIFAGKLQKRPNQRDPKQEAKEEAGYGEE
jgi:hypothetical protein